MRVGTSTTGTSDDAPLRLAPGQVSSQTTRKLQWDQEKMKESNEPQEALTQVHEH